MKTISEGDFKNKKVLVRCDFNVALDPDGRIVEEFRIEKTLPTINFLLKKGAAVILMSHMEKDGKPHSLEVVAKRLEKMLLKRVKFVNDCVGERVAKEIRSMKPGQIVVLENLRFHPEEKSGSEEFARELASLGDCYVNEAFACSHRAHASIAGIPKYLPSFAGMQLEKELENLGRVLKNPLHPFVVIIGGSKVETKSGVILNLSKIADHILLGSKIGAKILMQKNQLMGREVDHKDASIDLIDLTSSKINLPIDGVLALKDISEGYLRTAAIGRMRSEEDIYDIGPETIRFFTEIIKDARTILFNGPMGLFEEPQFASGTKSVIEAISRTHTAYRVAGGGETLEAIHKYKAEKTFNFLSTGGGAMLEYLAGDVLPGVAALDIIPDHDTKTEAYVKMPFPKK